MSGQGVYPLSRRLRNLGECRKAPIAGSGMEPRPLMNFGHYIRNFVQFHACFSAFWNLTGKANKTDPIRPIQPAISLEGARAPRLDPPMPPGPKIRTIHDRRKSFFICRTSFFSAADTTVNALEYSNMHSLCKTNS